MRFLSLAELGSATGCLEAVLLSLLHSRVAGKEAGGLESGTVSCVYLEEGARDAVTDSACLTGKTAAENGDFNVNLAGKTDSLERLTAE